MSPARSNIRSVGCRPCIELCKHCTDNCSISSVVPKDGNEIIGLEICIWLNLGGSFAGNTEVWMLMEHDYMLIGKQHEVPNHDSLTFVFSDRPPTGSQYFLSDLN